MISTISHSVHYLASLSFSHVTVLRKVTFNSIPYVNILAACQSAVCTFMLVDMVAKCFDFALPYQEPEEQRSF